MKKTILAILFLSMLFVAGFLLIFERGEIDGGKSPDGQFSVYAVKHFYTIFLPVMPGQSSDLPGRIYLRDNVQERVIKSTNTPRVSKIWDAEWYDNRVEFGRGDESFEILLPRKIDNAKLNK
ncbi:hypothetical protein [Reichenbachiella versicolor]|uniref:hypothetical protein n=1 Tax=Reichenbachiella versicolor TaxID=1821036 RepID=UPI000D6EA108|nr:hypothetical protein [Reichenbachiella versicolor]